MSKACLRVQGNEILKWNHLTAQISGVSLNLWINLQLGGVSRCYRVKVDLASKHFPFNSRLHKLFQHLLETKGLDYILTVNIQSDPLEKRFGR